ARRRVRGLGDLQVEQVVRAGKAANRDDLLLRAAPAGGDEHDEDGLQHERLGRLPAIVVELPRAAHLAARAELVGAVPLLAAAEGALPEAVHDTGAALDHRERELVPVDVTRAGVAELLAARRRIGAANAELAPPVVRDLHRAAVGALRAVIASDVPLPE